jgi:hypothetical protein
LTIPIDSNNENQADEIVKKLQRHPRPRPIYFDPRDEITGALAKAIAEEIDKELEEWQKKKNLI